MEHTIKLSEQELRDREELEWLLNVIEGRQDYKSKLLVLQDLASGAILETTSRLTKGQQLFASLALSAYEQWPKIFGPIKNYTVHVLRVAVSDGGGGRKETVDLARATSEGNKAPNISLAQVSGGKTKVEKKQSE